MVLFDLVNEFGLMGLFLATFLSASIVPFPSEPAIVFALTFSSAIVVFIIALLAGILGGITNYYIGSRSLHNFLVKRSPKNERKAQRIFKRIGIIALLIAPWIPFIGDPLLIVAGMLKMNFKKFLIFSTLGKAIKIAVVIYLGQALFQII